MMYIVNLAFGSTAWAVTTWHVFSGYKFQITRTWIERRKIWDLAILGPCEDHFQMPARIGACLCLPGIGHLLIVNAWNDDIGNVQDRYMGPSGDDFSDFGSKFNLVYCQPSSFPESVVEPTTPTENTLDDSLATITLRISYFHPIPGQRTSKILAETLVVSPPFDGINMNMTTVWGPDDGERPGAELHRCAREMVDDILVSWSDAAELLQMAVAQRGIDEARKSPS